LIKGMGDRLWQLRSDMNLSQKDLGQLVGVSPSSIGGYESGDRVPSLDVLISLSRVFHVSTDYILLGSQKDTGKLIIDLVDYDEEQIRLIMHMLRVLSKEKKQVTVQNPSVSGQ